MSASWFLLIAFLVVAIFFAGPYKPVVHRVVYASGADTTFFGDYPIYAVRRLP